MSISVIIQKKMLQLSDKLQYKKDYLQFQYYGLLTTVFFYSGMVTSLHPVFLIDYYNIKTSDEA
jgi:hypothetical protein